MSLNQKNFFILLGPVIFIILQLKTPEAIPPAAYDMLCITLWMAVWWVTEAVSISVTALLPIVLFPLTGAVDLSTTTAAYGNKYIFLFMGGFLLAIAIQKWNLHKRIALNIISLIGTNIYRIILGFMVATAFLSMWISNTATVVMLFPMGLSIIALMEDNPSTTENETQRFGKALMLGMAYAASIGGVATLIGTPPNLIFAGFLNETYGIEITFWQWFKFGFPISFILLGIAWIYLTRYAFKFKRKGFAGGRKEVNALLAELGPLKKEEKLVLVVFTLTAFFWITRSFIFVQFFPALDDTIIAMTFGILLFTIPANNTGERLIDWEDAVKLPWGIIILFGGGMALAAGFQHTGLAEWFGTQISLFRDLSLFILILIIVAAVNFLTEVTSNTASTAMLLPIIAPIAIALGIHPFILLVATTTAASCAFMLPVATPPNAVVFGCKYLTIPNMVKSGIFMNLISIILISLIIYFLLPYLWNFDPLMENGKNFIPK
ncbi:DASS family sodium-coupled anion symporter [Antarcticibacterium flavum]|uniref:DASS family sodium-coupled anion symporter n=1 Tax=Antarcticibacterium flavum TaxID=2058175 RepID=A0A5B7X3I0_9FLAO|nr:MULTISPECIES: DASS family sodium-coupled anion symporter [Antarcticibacterium]MCM4160088.1 anion transporter [Antarcticibacterium sp. W02-3]QCY69645.1 DASS family sodium-coupled anion symporter [Antarcticibacterium flavum]